MSEEETGSWNDGMSTELRDNPSLADMKNLDGLAQAYIDTKAMVGGSLRIPTEEAGEEVINSFVEDLLERPGLPLMRKVDIAKAPEDASGYDLVEGFDPEAYGALAQKAQEANLSKEQFESIAGAMLEVNNESVEKGMQPFVDEMNKLKGEWGGAYDEKVNRIQQFIKANKSDLDFVGGVAGNQVGAEWLRLFDGIVTQFGGEGTEIAKQMTAATEITPNEIEQRRDELINRVINENLTAREQQNIQAQINKYSNELVKLQAA